MKQMKRKFLAALALVLTMAVFPSVSWSSVSFTGGDRVKLGYSTTTPPVWEVKELPGATKNLFLGASLSAGGSYGDTNDWMTSNVRRYLNTSYLPANFSPDELATGVLTPYGNTPVYDAVVPDMDQYFDTMKKSGSNFKPKGIVGNVTIPPSSAGESLVWILDVQEVQALYNGAANLPWNDAAKNAARIPYAVDGPYRTRSAHSENPLEIWSINSNGSFFRSLVSASPSIVRPVVSPDVSVMLYKRGTGTQTDPYDVTYRWDVIPAISVGANTITLRFPQGISNNGVWPGPEAWKIFDENGTTYTVTGTSGMGEKMTLTVLPAIPQNAQNTALTLKYFQQFDDASQGLNNTKGAVLRASNPPSLHFGLVDMTLEIEIAGDDDGGDGDNGDNDDNEDGDGNGGDGGGSCECDEKAGTCLCGSAGAGCGCTHDELMKILSDNVHYLVLENPYVLDLEAEGGVTPYAVGLLCRPV
jgi:hypothetical protein